MIILLFFLDKITGNLGFAVVHADKGERKIFWHFCAKLLTLFHGAGSCLQVIDACLFFPKIYLKKKYEIKYIFGKL